MTHVYNSIEPPQKKQLFILSWGSQNWSWTLLGHGYGNAFFAASKLQHPRHIFFSVATQHPCIKKFNVKNIGYHCPVLMVMNVGLWVERVGTISVS